MLARRADDPALDVNVQDAREGLEFLLDALPCEFAPDVVLIARQDLVVRRDLVDAPPATASSAAGHQLGLAGEASAFEQAGDRTKGAAGKFCNRLNMLESRKPCYGVTPPKKILGKDPKTRTPITAIYLPGDGYRLPTEAEWEFAAHAGKDTRRPSNGKLISWLGLNHERTYPVATTEANPFE